MKTLARNLCHRPKSPSTNTRSTYGDNYRAPYTFIRGVHLAQRIPGAREREIKRRGVSRSPFFFPKRGISLSLSGWGGPSIRQHERDYHTRPHNRRTHNRPRTTFPVSCYSCRAYSVAPSLHVAVLSADNLLATRQIYANPLWNTAQGYCYSPLRRRMENAFQGAPSPPRSIICAICVVSFLHSASIMTRERIEQGNLMKRRWW